MSQDWKLIWNGDVAGPFLNFSQELRQPRTYHWLPHPTSTYTELEKVENYFLENLNDYKAQTLHTNISESSNKKASILALQKGITKNIKGSQAMKFNAHSYKKREPWKWKSIIYQRSNTRTTVWKNIFSNWRGTIYYLVLVQEDNKKTCLYWLVFCMWWEKREEFTTIGLHHAVCFIYAPYIF